MGATWAEHYAELGGNELWNSARLAAYVENGVGPAGYQFFGCGCETLPEAIAACFGLTGGQHIVYDLPETDGAPWFDPSDPVSADFAGLLVTDVSGLQDSPRHRSTFDALTGGSAIGRVQYGGRKFVVSGYLIGRTCCAITYGLRWLGWQAQGSQCQGGCGTDDFRFLECCPAIPEDSCGSLDRTVEDPAKFLRTLSRTALIEGPHVVERLGGGCGRCAGGCELLKVELTFASGSPYLFAEPILSVAGSLDISQPECPGWVKVLSGQECPDTVCPGDDLVPCAQDPLCGPVPLPPVFTLDPHPCYCDGVQAACMEAEVPVDDVGAFDATTIIRVEAGSGAVRRLRVQVALAPGGGSVNWDCDVCQEIFVSYIPPGGVLEVDGRARSAVITCGGATFDATPQILQPPDGIPFDYIDLECFGYAVRACADTYSPDNHFEFWTVPRST
jgi:hypothetical protein